MLIRAEETTYPIYFTMEMQQTTEALISNWLSQEAGLTQVTIVTDELVYSRQQAALLAMMKAFDAVRTAQDESCHIKIDIYQVPAGEHSKSISEAERLWNYMADRQFTRKDLLIAFGGGMIGDLVGFCAATYLRGLNFIQVPTTLLAQIDSSIGGKVAVNMNQGKNLIGQFYLPKLVVIDVAYLETLEDDALISGLGEMIKYGLLGQDSVMDWLKRLNGLKDLRLRIKTSPQQVEEQIKHCLALKKTVVEADFREQGLRKHLNLGHTIGHAIEQASGYKLSHGLCVAQGICWVYELAILALEEEAHQTGSDLPMHNDQLEVLKIQLETVKVLMNRLEMPPNADLSAAQLLSYVTSDKKREGLLIQFVWPTGAETDSKADLASLEIKHRLMNIGLDKLGELMVAVMAKNKETAK